MIMKFQGYLPDSLEIGCGSRLQYFTFGSFAVKLEKVDMLKVVAIHNFPQSRGGNFYVVLSLIRTLNEVIHISASLIFFNFVGQDMIRQQILHTNCSIDEQFCRSNLIRNCTIVKNNLMQSIDSDIAPEDLKVSR